MSQQKVAIVTGGARNIGKTISLRLAREGMRLAIVAPEADEVEATTTEFKRLNVACLPLVVDIRREDQVQSMAEAVRHTWGRIDLLVNNAGIIGPTAPVPQVSLDDWSDVLAVNLTGAFLCAKHVLPVMTAQRSGKIVNISSIAGKIGYALRSPYAVSKWGLIGLTLTLAKEGGPHNIQVNAICPGPVEGERMRRVMANRARETGQSDAEVRQWYLQQMALGRFVQAEDIAAMVAYLASPQADNITGQAIDVTAGYGL